MCINRCVPHSRPLGEVALVCDPSLFVSADRVVHIRTPGHVGKHFEQVLHLLWRQRTVSVLDQEHTVRLTNLDIMHKNPHRETRGFHNFRNISHTWIIKTQKGSKTDFEPLTLSCLSKTLWRKRYALWLSSVVQSGGIFILRYRDRQKHLTESSGHTITGCASKVTKDETICLNHSKSTTTIQ